MTARYPITRWPDELGDLATQIETRSWQDDDGIADSVEVAIRDGAIRVMDNIYLRWWQEFEIRISQQPRTVVVFTDGVPPEWNRSRQVRVTQIQAELLRAWRPDLQTWCGHNDGIQIHRDTREIPHEFTLLWQDGTDQGRGRVVRALEDAGLLENSLYSRPQERHRPARTLEGDRVPRRQHFGDRMQALIGPLRRAHCHIALAEYSLEPVCGCLGEKQLFPILARVPWIWVASDPKVRAYSQLGLRPNDPTRSNLRAVQEQLWWLRHQFQDPDRAQRWHDQQEHLIRHNRRQLDRLSDHFREHILRERARLGI